MNMPILLGFTVVLYFVVISADAQILGFLIGSHTLSPYRLKDFSVFARNKLAKFCDNSYNDHNGISIKVWRSSKIRYKLGKGSPVFATENQQDRLKISGEFLILERILKC